MTVPRNLGKMGTVQTWTGPTCVLVIEQTPGKRYQVPRGQTVVPPLKVCS